MKNDQLKRIACMEERFDTVCERVQALQGALDAYEAALPGLHELVSYYDSGTWRRDYLDDENGLLPEDLKRGVLSEDGIFNLLADIAGITEQLRRVGTDLTSPHEN